MSILIPAPRLLQLLAGLALLAIVAAVLPLLESEQALRVSQDISLLLMLVGVVALSLLLIDGWLLWRTPAPEIVRELAATLPVNGWATVKMHIRSMGKRVSLWQFFDHHPGHFDMRHLPQSMRLAPDQQGSLEYQVRPGERGDAHFGQCQCLCLSPFGMWRRNMLAGHAETVRVYPDFAAITRYELLATDNQASQLGIRRRPRRGQGLEFMQLRDYREGDSLRQIDWKATIRRDKLISREYQDERDQQLLFMLDCGHQMRTRDGLLSHFDHSLNALLLLSYIALKQGDSVGLLSFGGSERWLPPVKGNKAVNQILNQVYDLQPGSQAADFYSAAQQVLKRQRKRSLVVLITKVYQENIDELLPVVAQLRRRHLVLVANLQEEVVRQALTRPVADVNSALDYLGASDYKQQRDQIHRRLHKHGVLSLDVSPAELAVAMVNSYLEIKRQGEL